MSTTQAPPNQRIANEVLRPHAEAIRLHLGELAPERFRCQRVALEHPDDLIADLASAISVRSPGN